MRSSQCFFRNDFVPPSLQHRQRQLNQSEIYQPYQSCLKSLFLWCHLSCVILCAPMTSGRTLILKLFHPLKETEAWSHIVARFIVWGLRIVLIDLKVAKFHTVRNSNSNNAFLHYARELSCWQCPLIPPILRRLALCAHIGTAWVSRKYTKFCEWM